ncbi:MAG TPA: PKD domain-containing protein [Saprospiraceae bacterium]|nr:PKD domain-containing protein [Saprospiraceae bacterium]
MKHTITHLISLTTFLLIIVFTQANAQTGCHASFGFHQTAHSLTIVFTDSSTSPHTIIAWLWDFGDGNTSTEQNPSHTYIGPETYQVCLTISDDHGCTTHACHNVMVHSLPAGICHAAFIAHQSDPAQQTIDFTDHSTSDGMIGSWSWDFGDGSTSTEQNPSHTYAHPGTYLVCLIITDDDGGCTNHVCHHVVVQHSQVGVCHAVFVVHQSNSNQQTLDFTDQSTSDGTIGSWAWDFGDGNTSTEQNPSHTYAHPGTYLVCLIITDDDGGCTNHMCHHVVVLHPQAEENNVILTVSTHDSSFDFRFNNSSHLHSHALVAQSFFHIKTDAGDGSFDNQEYIVNYPNPFASSTTIQYELTDDADVKIEIYDMFGNRIRQIIREKELAGIHTQVINADTFNPGFYFIKMIVNDESFIKTIMVIK